MAILNNDTIIALEKTILNFKRNHKLIPHGYPVSLVSDLLETMRYQKNLKKKYQYLAEKRGQCLMEIFSKVSREIDKTTEVLES